MKLSKKRYRITLSVEVDEVAAGRTTSEAGVLQSAIRRLATDQCVRVYESDCVQQK